MGANLKKPIGNAYLKIIYIDLNGRTNKVLLSPTFVTNNDESGGFTEIGMEYVFYTREASGSGLLFQLYKRNMLSRDKMWGEMRLLVDPYSKPNKVSKMWEVTKTFTRVVRIPEYYLVDTTMESEGEILQNETSHVDKKSERAVTKISAKIF